MKRFFAPAGAIGAKPIFSAALFNDPGRVYKARLIFFRSPFQALWPSGEA